MANNWQQFENYLAQWVASVQGMTQAVETWANNKADTSAKDNFGNPTFDFATAQADLESARAALETAVATVAAL